MALALLIKAHFRFQIPENLTKNPKILRKIEKKFLIQKIFVRFSQSYLPFE